MCAHVCSVLQPLSVTQEVPSDVATVLKREHDVGEPVGVTQADRVPDLVDAGQEHDGVPKQLVTLGALVNGVTEPLGRRVDVDLGDLLSTHLDSAHLAVLADARPHPVDADDGVVHRVRFDELQGTSGCVGPRIECPARELGVRVRLASVRRGYVVRDQVTY